MEPLEPGATIDALDAAYGTIRTVLDGLGDAELMRPSRCAGWCVADVVYHQLLDVRRSLRTFASPSTDVADVDDVTYWRAFQPDDPDAPAHARFVRICASAYGEGQLAWEWRETTVAAVRAARACTHERVTTQGHTLRTTDFVATLAVESVVHHLDLTVALDEAPPPDPAALRLVRRVLDGLLGTPVPVGWNDTEYALKGTGRVPLTEVERATLGPLADRVPLLG